MRLAGFFKYFAYALLLIGAVAALAHGSGRTAGERRHDDDRTSEVRRGKIDVTDFGAAGDGETDDADAIARAAEHAAGIKNSIIYFPPSPGYATSRTIRIPAGAGVEMDAPLVYAGSSDEPCLEIGAPRSVSVGRRYRINVVRKKLSDWSSEACVGALIYNANSCDIEVMQASRFTVGVRCIGDGGGFAYNGVRLLYINSNKIGLDLTNANGGWTNENTFMGGRFSVDTSANTSEGRYGVRITSKEEYYNNNNLFIRPSFELEKKSTSGEAVPVLAEYAQFNEFRSCRDEGNGPVFARVKNESQANVFEVGFGGMRSHVEEEGEFPSSVFESRWNCAKAARAKVFDSGPMSARANYFDAERVHVPGAHVAYASGAGVHKAGDGIRLGGGFLELSRSRAVGVFIDTGPCRKFVVKTDCDPSDPPRVAVRCYGGGGEAMGGGGHVKGMSNLRFSFSRDFGGTYSCSPTTEEAYFVVVPAVKKIAVLLSGGRTRSFSVYTPDRGAAAAWPGYAEPVPGANLAASAPARGKWEAGSMAYNALPEPGEYAGWVCVKGGAPGKWKGFGLIER